MLATAQIKLNLPIQMKILAEKKAKKYGLTLSSYLRYLLLDEIKVEEYPVYEPSEETERAIVEAKREEREGKLVEVKDVAEFFKNL